MNWYQITLLSEDAFYGGKIEKLTAKFWLLLKNYAQLNGVLPTNVQLFVSKELIETTTIYFSPKCAKYCPELLRHYSAVICNKPPRNIIISLAGTGSWEDL